MNDSKPSSSIVLDKTQFDYDNRTYTTLWVTKGTVARVNQIQERLKKTLKMRNITADRALVELLDFFEEKSLPS